MKKIYIEGQVCIGPTFSKTELALIKRNLNNTKGLETLAASLTAAGNEQRLKILYLLHAHHELCVCDLAEILELTDSAISQHLRKLRDRNLVKTRRQGQTIFYSLAKNVFIANLQDVFLQDETKVQHAFVLKESK
ncbi:MAG: winged helix-turn-helix transcriptional regulator [Deferribacteres bacterium]|nr:winged helix-turn-helix transcriptional regulator [candidate division KSB1 bacterium]MCB9503161.1 winged helix-turn-helix transcriptional regulator [Deferribacteres bacterium]